MMRPLRYFCLISISLTLLTGCSDHESAVNSTSRAKSQQVNYPWLDRRGWPDYPDVPVVELMTEVDGIPIPRVETEVGTLDLNAKIPVDANNPGAANNPTEPVTGGRLVMRMHSEPKTMNPITESSAVQSMMSKDLVFQSFARRNLETFKFEPMLATHWVSEDSIKLAPDYPGYERFVSLAEAKSPAFETMLEYPEFDPAEEPPKVTLTTYGRDKSPRGHLWVGLYPQEKIPGVPPDGYHYWSEPDGSLLVSGIKAGRYTVKVGHEIIGQSFVEGDGGLRIKPESPKNPLEKLVADDGYLTLSKDEYISLHKETTYTYFIDPRAKWSDGTPFTSRDVVFAYHLLHNQAVDCDDLRVYYSDVIRCDALDDLTVQLQYRQQYFQAFEFTSDLASGAPPWHLFEAMFAADGKTLTMEHLTPAEEKAQNKVSIHGIEFGQFFNNDPRYNRAPMGTGPYIITEWKSNDRISLKRNPGYWSDKRGGYLDEIEFKIITDDNSAINALRAGDIDFLEHITAEHYHKTLGGPPDWMRGKYVKAKWYIPSYSYIGWNLLRPLFQDREVRIALALLLDMEKFRKEKHFGDSQLVSGSVYCFSPAYDKSVKPIGFSIDTARDLLSEAGWADTDGDGILDKNGVKFSFEYAFTNASENGKRIGELFRENCEKVGIEVNVRGLDWASYLEKIKKKDYDSCTLAWVSEIENDPYQLWHSSGASPQSRGSNHVSFSHPIADELIEQVRVTLDQQKRYAIFKSFHRLLDREQPYAFLYTPMDFGAYDQKYRGVKWYRLRPGFDLTEWYVPKELQ